MKTSWFNSSFYIAPIECFFILDGRLIAEKVPYWSFVVLDQNNLGQVLLQFSILKEIPTLH